LLVFKGETMMKKLAVMLCLVLGLSLASAQEKGKAAKPAAAREPGLYATIDTTMGKIVVKLFEKEAPKTVANFVDLATGKKAWTDYKTKKSVTGKPLYDGIMFHRVIPNFMIQTGAHLPDGGARIAANIPDEFGPGLKHDRPGRLSMANAGPNTGSSQFFITTVPTPHLDGKHAIFGQVIEGQDVATAIGNVQRDPSDKPLKPVLINKVSIERVGPEPAAKPAAAEKKPQ
jgi:peptidyl-prolyl cis-trans isomerase A (cyclophilin A)